MSDESLGSRLRHARERRQIEISAVAARTKIVGALLEGLERDDVSRWPSGLYRRSFVRAYAEAIGLDPEPVVREFVERFPDPAQPVAHAGPAAAPVPPAAPATDGRAHTHTALRLTLADVPSSFIGGRLISRPGRRLAAVACDAAVVLTIATAFLLTLGDFWLPLSLTLACYYLGGILILGNTPGVCLFALRPGESGERSWWEEDATASTGGLWRLIGQRTIWATGSGRRSDHEPPHS